MLKGGPGVRQAKHAGHNNLVIITYMVFQLMDHQPSSIASSRHVSPQCPGYGMTQTRFDVTAR